MSVEAVTESTIEKGGVLALLYFDVIGDNKEDVEGILVDLTSKMSGEEGVVYALGKVEKAIESEDKKYSTAAEVKILTKTFPALVNVCARYGPMAIEIIEPNEIRLKLTDAHQVLFDTVQRSQDFTLAYLFKVLPKNERGEFEKKLKKRMEEGRELLRKMKEEKGKEG